MLSRVVQSLLDVKDPGVVPPKPGPSALVVDNRPRDAQGRFPSEYEVWAGDANRSMKEIRARADREPAFRERFQATAVAQALQDGGLRIAGAPTRTATAADHQLLGEFVRLFKTTPSSQFKP
jgi:hypothetical protein